MALKIMQINFSESIKMPPKQLKNAEDPKADDPIADDPKAQDGAMGNDPASTMHLLFQKQCMGCSSTFNNK